MVECRLEGSASLSPSQEEPDIPKKEVVSVGSAAPNPNLSPATKFGDLVFVAGQTGRHPVTGEVGKDVREADRPVRSELENAAKLGHPR